MRIVIQRVSQASVTIEEKVQAAIEQGYVLLVGITASDNETIATKMADKIAGLRIFEDDQQKLNLSIEQIAGQILSISQFTLYADCKKGRRPSFIAAAAPDYASNLYDYFNEQLVKRGLNVSTGIFQTDMKVSLINDGPVTIVLDSDQLF